MTAFCFSFYGPAKNKIGFTAWHLTKKFLATTSCETEFRYPTGCEGIACDYIAKWEYSTARKDVHFEISAKELGRWTGIGFSRDGSMANSDVYTGWVYEGKAYITDRFAYGRQLPAIDPSDRQDIYDISGKIEDDIQVNLKRMKNYYLFIYLKKLFILNLIISFNTCAFYCYYPYIFRLFLSVGK